MGMNKPAPWRIEIGYTKLSLPIPPRPKKIHLYYFDESASAWKKKDQWTLDYEKALRRLDKAFPGEPIS